MVQGVLTIGEAFALALVSFPPDPKAGSSWPRRLGCCFLFLYANSLFLTFLDWQEAFLLPPTLPAAYVSIYTHYFVDLPLFLVEYLRVFSCLSDFFRLFGPVNQFATPIQDLTDLTA